MKQSGQWKIVSAHFSAIPKAQQPTPQQQDPQRPGLNPKVAEFLLIVVILGGCVQLVSLITLNVSTEQVGLTPLTLSSSRQVAPSFHRNSGQGLISRLISRVDATLRRSPKSRNSKGLERPRAQTQRKGVLFR
jgi:hypothetical protein